MSQDPHFTDQYSFILAPSKIGGIGVFATHTIKKGVKLTVFINDTLRFIRYDNPILRSRLVKNFCIWYCVEEKGGYSCPKDFRTKDIGWYLNHSAVPNAYSKDEDYYALHTIEKGEEILIDYKKLSTMPQNLKPIKFVKK